MSDEFCTYFIFYVKKKSVLQQDIARNIFQDGYRILHKAIIIC